MDLIQKRSHSFQKIAFLYKPDSRFVASSSNYDLDEKIKKINLISKRVFATGISEKEEEKKNVLDKTI